MVRSEWKAKVGFLTCNEAGGAVIRKVFQESGCAEQPSGQMGGAGVC